MAKEKKEKSSYELLKDLILNFHIKPNERMTEVFLAEKMNMSRIPVREAIQQLVHEGFIERTGKTGYQIKEYNEQDIIDLYNYREAMDGMLTRLFTQRVDESQIYFLGMNVESMGNKLEDFDHTTFSKIDHDFHRIIARGARNRYMEHQHEIILEKVLYVADLVFKVAEEKEIELLTKDSYQETYKQHCEIFKYIEEKNPDMAEKTARESVQIGLKKALLVLSKRG
ncbi:MAG: GntR family transcriptional regulator [Spirochaetaceae bacterium]